jgi:hypothetical protein
MQPHSFLCILFVVQSCFSPPLWIRENGVLVAVDVKVAALCLEQYAAFFNERDREENKRAVVEEFCIIFLSEVYVIIQDSISWSTFHSIEILPMSETLPVRTMILPISQLASHQTPRSPTQIAETSTVKQADKLA